LYILDEYAFEGDLILGLFAKRETCFGISVGTSPDEKVNLFTQLPLCIVEENGNDRIR